MNDLTKIKIKSIQNLAQMSIILAGFAFALGGILYNAQVEFFKIGAPSSTNINLAIIS